MTFQKRYLVPAVLVAALVFGACTSTTTAGQKAAKSSASAEQDSIATGLVNMLKTQPLPRYAWSQLRQNLIELETAQADTTQTTSFFFNQGSRDPIQECPSIGFPIAGTTQLSNPQQKITDVGRSGGNGNVTTPQIDPNGVYSGESTGTYVICVDAQGRAYADYWEGFVQTVTGPAKWDETNGKVELIGAPSFKFSTNKSDAKP